MSQPPVKATLQISQGESLLTGTRRHMLERRLEDGYRRIEQAVEDWTDVRAWETFWLELLAEYEAVCDDLSKAA